MRENTSDSKGLIAIHKTEKQFCMRFRHDGQGGRKQTLRSGSASFTDSWLEELSIMQTASISSLRITSNELKKPANLFFCS